MMYEKVELSHRDNDLYKKLHSSYEDIGISRACAKFIKKKEWHTASYMRRGSIPIQQISFTTTMIVAYARPFAPGRGGLSLPKKVVGYKDAQKELHERILRLRHEEYAHSDADTIDVTPYRGSIISIQSIRDVCFSEKEVDFFLDMTAGLIARITQRMEDLRMKP